MSDPDRMQPAGNVTTWDGCTLPVFRDYDTMVIDLGIAGYIRLGLAGIGQLVTVSDDVVAAIRAASGA